MGTLQIIAERGPVHRAFITGGIDEQDIMARTGHRSTSAVPVYKRCSEDIRKTASRVLDANPPKRQYCAHEDPVASTSGTSAMLEWSQKKIREGWSISRFTCVKCAPQ